MDQELLQQIHRDVGTINGRLDQFCERLERHDGAIFGNGQPGLQIRVDRCEQNIESVRGAAKHIWSAVISVMGALVAAVAAWFKQP